MDQASTDNRTGEDDVEDVEHVDDNAGDDSCEVDDENVEDNRSVAQELEDKNWEADLRCWRCIIYNQKKLQ